MEDRNVLEAEFVPGREVVEWRPSLPSKPKREKKYVVIQRKDTKPQSRKNVRSYWVEKDSMWKHMAMVRVKGFRKEKGVVFDDLEQAAKYAENRIKALKEGAKQSNVPQDLMLGGVIRVDGVERPDPKCLLVQYIDGWEKHHTVAGKRTAFPEHEAKRFLRLAMNPMLNVKVAGVTYLLFKSFAESCRESMLPGSIQQYVSNICVAIDKMTMWENWEWPTVSPTYGVQKRLYDAKLIGRSRKRKVRPSEEQIGQLLSYFAHREKNPQMPGYGPAYLPIPMVDIFLVLDVNGFRRAEIVKALWTDLDVEHCSIWSWRKSSPKAEGAVLQEDGRWRKRWLVPVVPEVMEVLLRQPRTKGEPRIFPYHPGTIADRFTTACKKFGILNLHMHDLRRDALSKLVLLLGSFKTRQISSHTTEASFNIYTEMTPANAKGISDECKGVALPVAAKGIALPI